MSYPWVLPGTAVKYDEAVTIRNAQCVEIGHNPSGIDERESMVELKPVSRGGNPRVGDREVHGILRPVLGRIDMFAYLYEISVLDEHGNIQFIVCLGVHE